MEDSVQETLIAPSIGIKTADGKFYSVMHEEPGQKKRMVLTTATGDQTNAQIDLYRSADGSLENGVYIASLVIENVQADENGSVDILLKVKIDTDGNLIASAEDSGSGEHQSIAVSLDDSSEEDLYSLPDFFMDDELGRDGADQEVNQEVNNSFTDYSADSQSLQFEDSITEYDDTEDDFEAPETDYTFNPLLFGGFILLGLVVCFLLIFLMFQLVKGEPVPAIAAMIEELVRFLPLLA